MTALMDALARYGIAAADQDRFDATVYAEAKRAYDQAEAAFRKAWPPTVHAITSLGVVVTTDDWRAAYRERANLASVRYVERCAWADHRASMEFVDAYDARWAALGGLPERVHLDAMTGRRDELSDALYAARDQALASPLADAADRSAWIDFIADVRMCDGDDAVPADHSPVIKESAAMTLWAAIARWWREIEPGFAVDRDNAMIERWDAKGEGPGWGVSFEGLGLSFMLFIGRTPRRSA